MLGQTLRMKKKRVTHPSQVPWDTQILFCDKNTLLQRGSVYTKKLKRLIGQAGWLTDWLTDWESKQTDSYILLHTALKHGSAFWREGGCGTLILSYISRFCPFLEIQNFELHFLLGVILGRDQTAPIGAVCSGWTLFASILDSSVMLGNYMKQTTSADDIFRCIFSWRFKG